ncbi:RTA-like protein [Kockovaella imperatae]|uniref:RTA-like protein n=1 Tax=Kockovaella imperatae TaxID=4999 RepID=A0A1Y1UK11_9TREE|nr:RTA-like protein [Kockovaella imperatae]ORX37806.1 RTA-like protein [Kockovaella imperatae]
MQLVMGVYWRTWWTLPTLGMGALVEVLGWLGRVKSLSTLEWQPNQGGTWYYNFNDFVMQDCLLVIAPTFFSAANYVFLGELIVRTNTMYSSIDIRSYRIIFITSDVLCLFIQAGGGAWAGTAPLGHAQRGAYMMTAGIILQLVVTVVSIILYIEWLYRWSKNRPVIRQYRPFALKQKNRSDNVERPESSLPADTDSHEHINKTTSASDSSPDTDTDKEHESQAGPEASMTHTLDFGAVPLEQPRRLRLMAKLLAFTTLLIVIRSLFRSVELADGWTGAIATNEPLFLVMDAAMMTALLFLYSLIHPGLSIGRPLKF